MPREELPSLEAREEHDATVPASVAMIGIVLVLLVLPAYAWVRGWPPVWNSASPPPTIHFCGRDYARPRRIAERLSSDPAVVEPPIEAVHGHPVPFPAVQTTRFSGADVCTTVLQIHDAWGWVAYGLVGGP